MPGRGQSAGARGHLECRRQRRAPDPLCKLHVSFLCRLCPRRAVPGNTTCRYRLTKRVNEVAAGRRKKKRDALSGIAL
jgi:hypothetical protein